MIRFALAAFVAVVASIAAAQDTVTLRLHQFLPATANVPANILRPWAADLEAASGGRIKIEFYDAMALGGKPADLYDQAKDGVVDIIQVLPGYTPGRFPRSEVFELPFMMKDPVAASRALMKLRFAQAARRAKGETRSMPRNPIWTSRTRSGLSRAALNTFA